MMTKWNRLVLGCTVAVAMIVANSAQAYIQLSVGDKITFQDRPGSSGGEFGLYQGTGTQTAAKFVGVTFCLERNEFLDFNTSAGFNIVGITDSAMYGSVGPSGDLVEVQTKWLYAQFNRGLLPGYDGTATAANKLQNAIWRFEGETYSGDMQYYNLAVAWFATATQAEKDFYNNRVKVLNITWASTRSGFNINDRAQDVLYEVPEPGSVAVWGFIASVFGGGMLYRRRRSAK